MNKLLRRIYKRIGVIEVGRQRTRDLFDFIENRKIDVVIDVGANVGQFAESLRRVGFGGRIISFEPTQAAFDILQKKARKDKNWEIHQCGLGESAGQAEIFVSGLSVCSSLLPFKQNAANHDKRIAIDHTEQITIRTLDEIAAGLTGNILLKIDTQGYERQVLEGGSATIPRMAGILMELPVIQVYEGVWEFLEAVKFMLDRGFVIAQVLPVGFHTGDRVSVVELDCLFRPKGPLDLPD